MCIYIHIYFNVIDSQVKSHQSQKHEISRIMVFLYVFNTLPPSLLHRIIKMKLHVLHIIGTTVTSLLDL